MWYNNNQIILLKFRSYGVPNRISLHQVGKGCQIRNSARYAISNGFCDQTEEVVTMTGTLADNCFQRFDR